MLTMDGYDDCVIGVCQLPTTKVVSLSSHGH